MVTGGARSWLTLGLLLGGCSLTPVEPGTYLCGAGGTCLPGAVCVDSVCVAPPAASATTGSSSSGRSSTTSRNQAGSSSGASNSGQASTGTAGGSSSGSSSSTGGTSTGAGSTSSGSSGGTSAGTTSTGGSSSGGSSSGGTSSGSSSGSSSGGSSSGGSSGAPTLSLLAGTIGGTEFSTAAGLAYDGSRYLYLADAYHCVIQQIDGTTGSAQVFAGAEGSCSSFDGVGASARFGYPYSIAYDGQGNLFVADTGNSTIRQLVVATQTVTTLAGQAGQTGSADGVGSAARFDLPYGIAADGLGNVFVADSNNQTLRQLVVSTAEVTTLAGKATTPGALNGTGSAARFYNPGGIAADGAGNVYVADCDNSAIRVVTVDGGVVSTFAGALGVSGSVDGAGTAARFNKPQQLAYDSAGYLYVADAPNSNVRQIEIAGANVTTFVGVAGRSTIVLGPLPGGLDSPFGVAISPGSPLFISDSAAEVVLEAN